MLEYNLPQQKFNVVLADFPSPYYGDPNKPQAAGKHYDCMTEEQIYEFPMRTLLHKNSVVLSWSTGPNIGIMTRAFEEWGIYCRGVAFVWIKTTINGKIIEGQGVRPSLVKSLDEFVLWGSPLEKGRPLSLKNESMGQNIFEPEEQNIYAARPQNVHSRKPEEIQNRIERLVDGPYCELFARRQRENWTTWGNQLK